MLKAGEDKSLWCWIYFTEKKTRQKSTQSVRNMPPPFPPCIIREMHWNPKFDPFHGVTPKGQKSTDHDQNVISYEGGQDSSACKVSGFSLHVFSRKCPEPPNLTRITKSNSTKIRKINRTWLWSNHWWRWSRYISMQNFRLFPSCLLQEMPENHKFDLFH